MSGRVLITGASGFVGYHLILEALKQGLEVVAAVRTGSNTLHLEELPIRFTTIDFTDKEKIAADLKTNRYDYIIHAAGRTKAKTQQEYNLSNAELTLDLATAALNSGHPLKKFVFISSLAALGPNNSTAAPITSGRAPAPVTAYGRSKLLAEQYLSALPDLPLITLRPTAVYGPRERDLFVIIKSIVAGIEPYIGNAPQQLSFVYVKDLATVTIAALNVPEASRLACNIADGNVYPRDEFAAITKRTLHKKTFRFNIPLVLVRVLAFFLEKAYLWSAASPVLNREKIHELTAANWSCSIEEAQQYLGYTPGYNLESGLKETIEWYKKNGWLTEKE